MRYDPSLFLQRLLVTKGGDAAYDQSFHLGVNIIRGENGSGKTTIADFIFFALGGEAMDWRLEAELCDYTFAEVQINGEVMTLRRQVSGTSRRPMSVFWGPLDSARESGGIEGWEVYPFASTKDKESFSQLLFTCLGMPEVHRADFDSRITMHQVLRLLYADQKTPYDQVFRIDQFDSVVAREAVGDLLLGVYDGKLYELKQRRRELDQRIEEIKSRLKGIWAVLGEDEVILTGELIHERIAKVRAEQSSIVASLSQEDDGAAGDLSEDELRVLEAREAVQPQQVIVRELSDRLDSVEYEIQDSDRFLTAVRLRLQALSEAEHTQEVLGAAVFKLCPSCYQPLDATDGDVCVVCRKPHDGTAGPNLLRLRHELQMQIDESESLQADRKEERNRLARRLPGEVAKLRQLQNALNMITATAQGSSESRQATLHHRLGYLERQHEDLMEKARLAASVGDLEAEKASLEAERLRVEEETQTRTAKVRRRKSEAIGTIDGYLKEILKRDLPREVRFQSAESTSFDFGKNMVAVEGRTNYAASSMTLLKNSFHLALLMASLEHEYFRYPRFALFDNIEDKGMEEARSHNFQKVLVGFSEKAPVDHQIIFTTSMMNPDLEDASYVIGPAYDHERKSLKF